MLPQSVSSSLRKFSGKEVIYYSKKNYRNKLCVVDSTKHISTMFSKKDVELVLILSSVHGFNAEITRMKKAIITEAKPDPRDKAKLKVVEYPISYRWIEENKKAVGLEITVKNKTYKLVEYVSLKDKLLALLGTTRLEDDDKLSMEVLKQIKTHKDNVNGSRRFNPYTTIR